MVADISYSVALTRFDPLAKPLPACAGSRHRMGAASYLTFVTGLALAATRERAHTHIRMHGHMDTHAFGHTGSETDNTTDKDPGILEASL